MWLDLSMTQWFSTQNLSHAGRFIMEISGTIQVQKVSSKYVCNNIKAFKDEALIYFFDRDWPNCDPFMSWISYNWTTNLLVRFHVSRIFIVHRTMNLTI